jgi:pyruvate,water dikinase
VNLLYWLDRLQPEDRFSVGEKAWQLGQLHREGYAVGEGFAIDAQLFRTFLMQLENAPFLLADFPASSFYLDIDNAPSLQWVAQRARQAIHQAPLPLDWQTTFGNAAQQLTCGTLILRASLSFTKAIAPSQSCLLTAQFCRNHPDPLATAIKRTWAQLLSAQSLFYWQRKEIDLTQIYLAVLVQPVGEAIAAGRLRLEGDRGEIEAVRGLGYALSQGETQPDRHYFEAGKISQSRLGHQVRAYAIAPEQNFALQPRLLSADEQNHPALSPDQLAQLMAISQRWQHQFPQSGILEWSFVAQPSGDALQIHQWIPCRTVLSPAIFDDPGQKQTPPLVGVGASFGNVAAIAHLVPKIDETIPILPDGCILIAPYIPPHWLPHLKTLKGIVVEQGGVTSHAAILARELGIPAIVAAKGATHCFQTGDTLLIDGRSGHISPQRGAIALPTPSPNLKTTVSLPSSTRTQLMVSLSQRQSLRATADLPLDGLGLLRSELMVMELLKERSLSQWLQPDWQKAWVEQVAALIQDFAAAFNPKPIFYRTFDRKNLSSVSPTSELHLHAQRGTHGYCLDPLLFDLELQAIQRVQAMGYPNLRIVLPFVRSVPEVLFCQQRLALNHLESLPLWIMVEVPSLLFTLPQYAKLGIEGIAIGSNDLAQLLLGRDRESTFHEVDPTICPMALLAALQQLVTSARSLNLACSICGQAPVQYPDLVPLLVDWGITAISVEPQAVAEIHAAIAHAEQLSIL